MQARYTITRIVLLTLVFKPNHRASSTIADGKFILRNTQLVRAL